MPYRIWLVCTGNTCRSSMAEPMLRRLLDERGIREVEVHSAGLAAVEGAPASPQAIEVMKEEGLDLSGHRAHRLTAREVAAADLILTMTSEHKRTLLQQYPEASGRVFVLREYAEGKELDPLLVRAHVLEQLEDARRRQAIRMPRLKPGENAGNTGSEADKGAGPAPGGAAGAAEAPPSSEAQELLSLQAELAAYDIEDPIGGDRERYRETARRLREALAQVVARLERELSPGNDRGKGGKKESD